MTIRVDRQGLDELYDAVGIGSTGGGVPIYDDGERMAPWEDKPWQSRGERAMSESLRWMAIPGDQIAQIRPTVPQQLFPPDIEYDRTPMGIMDILDTDRWSPQQRSWMSPTLRPVTRRQYEEDRWEGSARNVSMSSSPLS